MISLLTSPAHRELPCFGHLVIDAHRLPFFGRFVYEDRLSRNLSCNRPVQSWVEKNKELIELFFLPPYAPEYNPDEYLNNAVKQRTHRKRMSGNQKELSDQLHSTMAGLQKEPETIRKLFQARDVRYAA